MVLFLLLVYQQTQRAADRIKELLEGESAAGALGIRLGVKRRKFLRCCLFFRKKARKKENQKLVYLLILTFFGWIGCIIVCLFVVDFDFLILFCLLLLFIYLFILFGGDRWMQWSIIYIKLCL